MTELPKIGIKRLTGADTDLPLPGYATKGAAGADVRASFPADQRQGLTLEPGRRALVPTGLILEIPAGWEIQLRPRSGLALKHGITLANSPGTIDSDYRGELGVIMINLGTEPFRVAHGDRVAQLVAAPAPQLCFVVMDDVAGSERGDGGFGSTGVG